jgi:hypothetical protein
MKLSDVKIKRKNTFVRKKNNHQDPRGHERCKDSITIKNAQVFVRVGEELIELYG